jgi:hypothetical protein
MTKYKFKIYDLAMEVKKEDGSIALEPSGMFFTSSKKAFEYAHQHNARIMQYSPEDRAKCVKYGSCCYTHYVF